MQTFVLVAQETAQAFPKRKVVGAIPSENTILIPSGVASANRPPVKRDQRRALRRLGANLIPR